MSATNPLQFPGRSAPRLLDDLLSFHQGTGFFARNPISVSTGQIARPHYTPYAIKSDRYVPYEVTPLGARLYAFLVDNQSFCHLNLDLVDGRVLEQDQLYNFHLVQNNSPRDILKAEEYDFVCSVTDAKLKVIFRTSEFSQIDWSAFEQSEIDRRLAVYQEEHPDEFNESKKNYKDGAPQPVECLTTVYRILNTALNNKERSSIKGNNLIMNIKVSPQFLSKLGFRLDSAGELWNPPDVYEPHDKFNIDLRQTLIRMQHEVAYQLAMLKATTAPVMEPLMTSLTSFLRTTHYPRGKIPHGGHVDNAHYHAYVVLGAVEDFSDSLIMSIYNYQCEQDPENTPFYLEALKSIAGGRHSEELEMKVMELMSLGSVPVSELNKAYERFSLVRSTSIDEDLLIEMYKQVIRDRPSDSQEFKSALNIIANHLKSERLHMFLQTEAMTLDEAYVKLGMSPDITNDEFVHLAYETKLQEATEASKIVLNHALLMIAKARNSNMLLARYEAATATTTPQLSLEEAYALLGTNRSTSADTQLAIFNVRVNDNPEKILELRQALREIGKDLKSKAIENYLSGKPDLDLAKNKETPVGLENIGNTCYLNSLLQYYFTITPLREAVISFSAGQKDHNLVDLSDHKNQEKKVGGRAVTKFEVKRSKEFVNHLGDLFQELIHTPKSAIAPKKDLAYLALVPSWEDEGFEDIEEQPKPVQEDVVMIDSLDTSSSSDAVTPVSAGSDDEMFDVPSERSGTNKRKADDSLENKDLDDSANTDSTKVGENSPEPDAKTAELSRKIDQTMGRQQDVTECIGNVLFQLESAFDATGYDDDGEQLDIVKDLFYGKTMQVLEEAKTGSNRREKTERFSSLLVDVASGPRDIYDALDSYFGEDIMELDEVDTRRTLTISELPPVLQIQIQRVQFDRVLNQPFKSNALLRFDETIYMDRYLNSDDPELKRKRREVYDWRIELAKLKKRLADMNQTLSNGLSIRDTLASTKNWLKMQAASTDPIAEPKPETIEFLTRHTEELGRKIETIRTNIADLEQKIENQFKGMHKVGYRLHSVFIHRGQATFGHYWIYIRDFRGKVYRMYNDQRVTEVSESEIFQLEEGNTATPYFLVFIKEDAVEKLTCAVLRDIDETVDDDMPVEPSQPTKSIKLDNAGSSRPHLDNNPIPLVVTPGNSVVPTSVTEAPSGSTKANPKFSYASVAAKGPPPPPPPRTPLPAQANAPVKASVRSESPVVTNPFLSSEDDNLNNNELPTTVQNQLIDLTKSPSPPAESSESKITTGGDSGAVSSSSSPSSGKNPRPHKVTKPAPPPVPRLSYAQALANSLEKKKPAETDTTGDSKLSSSPTEPK